MGILAGLLYLVRKYYKKKEASRAQDEANHIQDDPVDWYREHFRVQPDATDGGKTKASDTTAGDGDRN